MLAAVRDAIGRVLAAAAGSPVFKPAIFLVCLVPGALLAADLWRFFVGGDFEALGVDPNLTVLHTTGETAVMILVASLSVTPLRRIFKANKLHNVRRMLGLWAFAYALMHLSAWLIFDQLCYSFETCQIGAIGDDLVRRPFITMGMLTFTILLALAATSTVGWQRRLKKNWTRLHRFVYLAAIAAIVHYLWIQKSDYSEPLRWGAAVAVLLGLRVWFAVRGRLARAPGAPRAAESA
jgi:sulfoxide reductase heme-binding subunit YedZ